MRRRLFIKLTLALPAAFAIPSAAAKPSRSVRVRVDLPGAPYVLCYELGDYEWSALSYHEPDLELYDSVAVLAFKRAGAL
jgi:hypothetical protein